MTRPEDGTPKLQPTTNYYHFHLAEKLGKTVRELLTGQIEPLSQMEHFLWQQFDAATARLNFQRQKYG